MRTARVVVVSLVACATACSLFFDGAEFSEADRPADAAVPDGSAGGGDGSNPSNDDATATKDGEADATAFDAARCDGAAFCDSFDDNAPLGTAWSTVVVQGAAALTYDDAAVSPPRSLRMDLPLRDSGAYRRAQLKKDLAPFPKTITCTMQLWLEDGVTGGAEGYGLFTLAPTTNLSGYLVELKIKPGDVLRLEESNNTGADVLTTSGTLGVSLNQWHTLVVTTDFQSAAFVLDGVTRTMALTSPATATADGGSAAITLAIGEDSDIDTEPFVARFDDVSCAVTPP